MMFLVLLAINAVFGSGLAAGALVLSETPPLPAIVAIACTLACYGCGVAMLGYSTLRDVGVRLLEDVDWLAERLPGLAMLGTIAGFLSHSHDATVLTVLTSTFVGVACWQALGLQHRLVARR